MNNNPVRYNDPTGHKLCGEVSEVTGNCYTEDEVSDGTMTADDEAASNNDCTHKDYCENGKPKPPSLDDITQKDDDAAKEPTLPAEDSWVDQLFGFKYTPLIASLVQLAAVVGIAAIIAAAGPAIAITALMGAAIVGLGFVYTTATIVGIGSTVYQESHGLNGVTNLDVTVSVVSSLAAPFAPVKIMEAAFIFSAFRTASTP